MRALFTDPELRADLESIRDDAKLSCTPSLLRTLDVIMWMRRHGHKDSSDQQLQDRPFDIHVSPLEGSEAVPPS